MKNRRKHFLIDRPLQFRYMAWILLILLTVTGALFASLYYGVWGQAVKEFSDESVRNMLSLTSRLEDYDAARYQTSQEGPRLAFVKDTERFSEREREIIQTILNRSHQRLLVLILPLIVLIGWGTVFLSHKIAGPIYHVNRILRQAAGKDLTARVHLRKHDEAQNLADSFNELAGALDRSVSRMKKIVRDTDQPARLKEELSKELEQFKTTGH
ncbi:MAG: methyl-accepting chemotaxis protein [Candidatus Omnitrophica bacterium]|nr:methyl-accepting chemotaxis protein [Candidatus Omnitrophota bacterium]